MPWSCRWLGLVVAVGLASGCLSSEIVQCEDGSLCPSGTVCDPGNGGCVTQEQIDACTDVDNGAFCMAGGEVDDGTCHNDVCLPNRCGNSRIDHDEVCDVALDTPCRSDCQSDLSCGNAEPDLVRGEQCDDGNLLSGDGCSGLCLGESTAWREIDGAPPPRSKHTMVYDPSRQRLVVFGGLDSNGFPLDDTWEWDGRGWYEVEAATRPLARWESVMTYDSTSEQVLLFGGLTDFGRTNDLWQWDGARWQELTPSEGDMPKTLSDAAFAYDPERQVAVLHGGLVSLISPRVIPDETWEWDGSSWTQRTPVNSPGERYGHSMAYHRSSGGMVLFGGNGDGATYVWDGTDWSIAADTSPTGAFPFQTQIAYDGARDRLVVYMGDDIWEWNGVSWQDFNYTVGAGDNPPQLVAAQLTYDPTIGQTVLFGGQTGGEIQTAIAGTYTWNGSTWSVVDVEPPNAPIAGAMVHDLHRGRSVLFGGQVPGAEVDDPTYVIEWDGRSWRVLDLADPPTGRQGHAMAYDYHQGVTILFGGLPGITADDDTWLLTGDSWAELTPAMRPAPRSYASMVYDGARRTAVLFGGKDETDETFSDTWTFADDTWTPASPAQSPPARAAAAMAYDPVRERVVVFGGSVGSFGDGVLLDDTWEWDGETWIEMDSDEQPIPRHGARMTYDPLRKQMVLYGGATATTQLRDAWLWNGSAWTPLITEGQPEARAFHTLSFHAQRGALLAVGPVKSSHELLLTSSGSTEQCQSGGDADGDGRSGCDDPDCWSYCTPTCFPDAACDADAPRCGDGMCNQFLENHRMCPADCEPAALCGDYQCDDGETSGSCPGDCD